MTYLSRWIKNISVSRSIITCRPLRSLKASSNKPSVLGLISPVAAIGLTILNVVAVLSLEEIAPAAFSLHVVWGMLLALVLLWGPGRIGVDTLLKGSGRNN